MVSSNLSCFRDFLEYVLSDHRGYDVDSMQFYLQTSLIPDEIYMGTILKQSRFKYGLEDLEL